MLIVELVKIGLMRIKSIYLSLISILLLSLGWLGVSGLPLLVALVPLLIISSRAEDSRRGWWQTFGWSLLTFAGWNMATIWWIGFAAAVAPLAATAASSSLSMVAFMCFHTASKKAPKALVYTMLITIWIALEHLYMYNDFSWPWLLLGNGFSNDIWAVQWYEYTGIYGGSLWVLLSNILLFEAISKGVGRAALAMRGGVVLLPILISLIIFYSYERSYDKQMQISVIQPNIDAYLKFSGRNKLQEENILNLLQQVEQQSDIVVLPETALPHRYNKQSASSSDFVAQLRDTLRHSLPHTTIITGINLAEFYHTGNQSRTARKIPHSENYVDYFNSVIAINTTQSSEMRDKVKLVIGVENTPTWIFDLFNFFVIDLGGIVGQLGIGEGAEPFNIGNTKVGSAICYEALYGDFYADFVRNGAQLMTIISNDGWWSDTPGHRHLYTISSLRAIETRRAIARSANTGTSGFIDERGVSIESMGWDRRGVITQQLPLNDKITLYVRYGDLIARISTLLAGLSLLYYIALRAKQRNHLA